MRAGKLNKRVQIQEPAESRDAHGGVIRTWNTVATRWASIEPLRGQELYQAQQMGAQATVRITMRSYSGLTEMHRIVLYA